jgi:hypothetical protein
MRAGKNSPNAVGSGLKGDGVFTPTAPHAAQQSASPSPAPSSSRDSRRTTTKRSLDPSVHRHPSAPTCGRRTSSPRHDRSPASGTDHPLHAVHDRVARTTQATSRTCRLSLVVALPFAAEPPRCAASESAWCPRAQANQSLSAASVSNPKMSNIVMVVLADAFESTSLAAPNPFRPSRRSELRSAS